ncbi:visual pigment-like receptor peropsin [Pecten maximus]|uniref:visual pigment-like receptor peropsin n=1 Tax=Pecten maximus TaxID=6579 RepID=UPI00145834BC|nr:visual pigment-like receptor peropsin [Pecten maximus]
MAASNVTLFDAGLTKPVNISVAVLFLIAGLIGIVANASIIFVFWKKHSSILNPTTCFVLALTVLDFFMSLVNMPMVIVSSFIGYWVFGSPGCTFYGFTMTFIGLTIIAVLTMISFDQYIVMVKKNSKHKRTLRAAKLSCIGCALWGLSWAIFPLIGINSYVFTVEGVHTSCAINWKSKKFNDLFYTMAMFVLCFLLPCVLICFFYGSIHMKVKELPRFRDVSSAVTRQELRQKYIAKTMLCMISSFILSWFPYAMVALWSALGDARDIPTLVTLLPAVFAKISVIWNPLIYAHRNRELKKAWREIFKRN